MTRLLRIAAGILAAGVLLAGTPTHAQGPAPSAPPPADAMAAAKELVEAAKTGDQFKTLMPLIMQQLKPEITKNRPAVEKDYDNIASTLTELANERVGQFTEAIATVYATNFTADEIKQVTAFFRTPAGEKFREKTGLIAQQSMQAGQKFGEQLMLDLQTRMKDELRKRGHKI